MQVGQSGKKELLKDKRHHCRGLCMGHTHSYTLEGSGMDAEFLPSNAFEW